MISSNFTLVLIAVIASANILVEAQRIPDGFPCESIKAYCRREAGVTAAQVAQWTAASTNCRDVFGEIDAARHYHVCLVTKVGFFDQNGNMDLQALYNFWGGTLSLPFLQKIHSNCAAAYVPTGKPYEKAYYFNKCVFTLLGAYPWRSKAIPLPIVIDAQLKNTCLKSSKLTAQELCTIESNTKRNLYDVSPEGRCYLTCVVSRLGYLIGNQYNWPLIDQFYTYLPNHVYKAAVAKCLVPLNAATLCDDTYNIIICFRQFVGEYPLNYDAIVISKND